MSPEPSAETKVAAAEEAAVDVGVAPGAEPDPYLSPELLEIFGEEAEEHLKAVGVSLKELAVTPDQRELVRDIRRSVHSLKGAATMIGLGAVSTLAHRMEDLLDELYEGEVVPGPQTLDLLFPLTRQPG